MFSSYCLNFTILSPPGKIGSIKVVFATLCHVFVLICSSPNPSFRHFYQDYNYISCNLYQRSSLIQYNSAGAELDPASCSLFTLISKYSFWFFFSLDALMSCRDIYGQDCSFETKHNGGTHNLFFHKHVTHLSSWQ